MTTKTNVGEIVQESEQMHFAQIGMENNMTLITKEMSIPEILKACPTGRRILDQHGLRGCGGEHGPAESLEFFASVHGIDADTLVKELHEEARNPQGPAFVYQESLGDYIYRRFFKAGIAVVLTVGALWGATNLVQIAMGELFSRCASCPPFKPTPTP